MAKLIIKDESGRDRAYLLSDAVIMAGRASTNSIQINDEKSSRQHFKIERRDNGYFAVDLGSTNGTKLNGSRLGVPTQLQTGDTLSVGKTTLLFESGPDSEGDLVAISDAPPPLAPEVASRPRCSTTIMLKNSTASTPRPRPGQSTCSKSWKERRPENCLKSGMNP